MCEKCLAPVIGDPLSAGTASAVALFFRVFFAGNIPGIENGSRKTVVQLALAMRKNEGRDSIVCEHSLVTVTHAIKHRIGGSHGWQCEKHSVYASCRQQTGGKQQGCLGFAAACDILDNGKDWALGQWHIIDVALKRAEMIRNL